MKIAIAQINPVPGDISTNIAGHISFIDLAVASCADLIIFPELSITGYAPTIAKELAVIPDDIRFDVFQNISDAQSVTIAIGAPTKSADGVCISLLLFHPRRPRQVYSKMYLHVDEEPFFVPGPSCTGVIGQDANIALAICYEVSVPEHAANAFRNGAKIYIASVADPTTAIDRVLARLSEIAREYSMTVLMSNCIGRFDRCEWAGRSSVWNDKGELLIQLDKENEGIIVFDTETGRAAK